MKNTILIITFIFMATVFLIGGILIISYAGINLAERIFVGIAAGILFLLFAFLGCETERKSGVYVCKRCVAEFEIDVKQYILSPHIMRSRRLRCPKCGEKSYCSYRKR